METLKALKAADKSDAEKNAPLTKLYGVVSGGIFTPYAVPPASSVVTTTPESDAVSGAYCVNMYQNDPYPYTTSST